MLLAYYPAWDRILVFQDRAEVVDFFFSLSLSQEALTCKGHMSYYTLQSLQSMTYRGAPCRFKLCRSKVAQEASLACITETDVADL